MKKRTLVVVALASTLTVGAFAHSGTQDNDGAYGQGMMNGQGAQNQGMMNRPYMQKQGIMNRGMSNGQYMQRTGPMNRRGGMGMMGGGMMGGQGMGMMRGGMMGNMQMFSQLNLSQEQRFQLSILRDEMRLEMRKLMHNGQIAGQFGKFMKGDSFDKKAFENHMNQKHKKMLDLMANNMEKAFKILTKEQVSELNKSFAKK
ncbi:MAG: Spy/CpxP family protein refolding chaperone [Campylobacteraceae bacterium]|nr:Spy/CpxP family protein refolding chaperone [Campylobacteraceae bacterium]